MSKLRKITHLRVFDFEASPYAYAIASNKNPFGYSYQNTYYLGKRKIYDGLKHDNVQDYTLYWLAFHINQNQLESLQRRVEEMEVGGSSRIYRFRFTNRDQIRIRLFYCLSRSKKGRIYSKSVDKQVLKEYNHTYK